MHDLELVPLSPVAAEQGSWHSERQGPVRFLVCKATYDLAPGACTLRAQPEPVQLADAYWEDDPRHSLRRASELVPPRPNGEVLLVGSAYAPQQTPTHRLVARLCAGPIEKAIEVRSDRTVDIGDKVGEGPPFTRMPLVWERAAGGPGTPNPVGRWLERNGLGKLLLPNLQPPAVEPAPPDWALAPIGLGPLSPHWPGRALGLRGPAPSLDRRSYGLIPDGFDFSFFQAAPRDQQCGHLPSDSPLLLEHLHPSLPTLVTRLPGHKARVVLEPLGAEIPLVCDAITIDTDDATVSLIWRASFSARDYGRATKALFALEPRDESWALEAIRDMVPSNESTLPRISAREVERAGVAHLPFDTQPAAAVRARANTSGTPFGGERLPEVIPSQNMERTAAIEVPRFAAETRMPVYPAPPPPPPAPPQPTAAPAAVARPVAAPVPVVRSGRDDASPSVLAAQHRPPSYMLDRPAAPERVSVGHAADVATQGVLAASHAAASAEPTPKKAVKPREPEAASATTRGPAIELLYFHAGLPDRVRAARKRTRGKERDDEWLKPGDAAPAAPDRDLRTVATALARAESLDGHGLKEALHAAVDPDGVMLGPLVACAGEITLAVDPFEQLSVTIALAEPFAATDRRVKEAIEAAQGLAQAHRATPHSMIDGATARLRQAFAGAVRSVPADYLETSAARHLAEERKFVRRSVFGETCLLGTIATGDRRIGREGGSAGPITFYLPAAAETCLPLVPSFAGKLYGVGRSAVDGSRAPQLFALAVAVTR